MVRRRRGRLALRRGLLLQRLSWLLLLLFRHVMADDATCRGASDSMMPGEVSCDPADDGSFDTALGVHSLRSHQERHGKQWRGNNMQFHDISSTQESGPAAPVVGSGCHCVKGNG